MRVIFCIVLFCMSVCNGQDLKLGKVSVEELKEKFHPADTSAPAAYLFKKGNTYFELSDGNFQMVTEVECRIKIYKKEGYRYANEEVSYYTGGKNIRVFFNDAYTYNFENGEIVKTKLKSDGEFEQEINENYKMKKIAMPNVKEGSVIEYRYTIITPYYTVFKDWYFQHEIPAKLVTYDVAIPVYFTYNTYLNGYVKVEQSTPKARRNAWGLAETTMKFTATDVKAIKNESYVNNLENFTSILKYELASVTSQDGSVQKYSTDWTSVSKAIYDDKDFGKELSQTAYFKEDIDALLAQQMLPSKKVEVIFNYVKNRMNWNEINSYYCEDGVKKAYETMVGNSAEINLMLTSMLRYARLDANPVLVSTRANGVALYPNRAAYNYVIAGVVVDDKLMLLDATSKNTVPNLLPVRAINWVGRMIKSNGTTAEVDLLPKKNSREVINLSAKMDSEGKITGKARDQYFDQYAYIFRENRGGYTKETHIQKLEKQYTGITIEDYTVSNEKELAKPVVEDYDFAHSSAADVIGDKIYFSPMLFYTATETPFKQQVREYPVDFTFPYQDRYSINIEIPEGYAVESLPKSVSMAMEQNIGSFKYNVASQNNHVQLSVSYDINFANISQDYYQTLRDFFAKMIEKQNEKVVLKKL